MKRTFFNLIFIIVTLTSVVLLYNYLTKLSMEMFGEIYTLLICLIVSLILMYFIKKNEKKN